MIADSSEATHDFWQRLMTSHIFSKKAAVLSASSPSFPFSIAAIVIFVAASIGFLSMFFISFHEELSIFYRRTNYEVE